MVESMYHDPQTQPAQPAPPPTDYRAFEASLRTGGIRAALAFLNQRTPHRYTGIFRYDGDMLRNVALHDKWDVQVRRGSDLPLAEAFCSVVHDTAQPLVVEDGASDLRFPHLRDGPVLSYCGALIRDDAGNRYGALCHYDVQPCQAKASDLPLMVAAAAPLYEALKAHPGAGDAQ